MTESVAPCGERRGERKRADERTGRWRTRGARGSSSSLEARLRTSSSARFDPTQQQLRGRGSAGISSPVDWVEDGRSADAGIRRRTRTSTYESTTTSPISSPSRTAATRSAVSSWTGTRRPFAAGAGALTTSSTAPSFEGRLSAASGHGRHVRRPDQRASVGSLPHRTSRPSQPRPRPSHHRPR